MELLYETFFYFIDAIETHYFCPAPISVALQYTAACFSKTAASAVCLTSIVDCNKVCGNVRHCACENVIHEGENIMKAS